MKKIRQLVFAILFLLPLMMSAQEQIKGNVKDDQGIDLPGVSVMVKGTTKGTATDFDGNFQIEVDANTILVFSYIGYLDLEMPVTADMQIVMQESAESLDEVVLIGYGTTTIKDATGAVASITEKDFNEGNIVNPAGLITGRVAGVNVLTDGSPGGGSQIRIRGGSSLGASNDPLIVVDGFPISNDAVGGSMHP